MIPIGSYPVWHPVFETLAYASGYGVFRYFVSERETSSRSLSDGLSSLLLRLSRSWVADCRGLAEQWPTIISTFRSGHFLVLLTSQGGKTIAGGLLGGWIAVETVKKLSGIQNRTGDLFALPLCVGIIVWRVVCLIAGLADDTYGKALQILGTRS